MQLKNKTKKTMRPTTNIPGKSVTLQLSRVLTFLTIEMKINKIDKKMQCRTTKLAVQKFGKNAQKISLRGLVSPPISHYSVCSVISVHHPTPPLKRDD